MDTNVCEGDSATFTCVVSIPSGAFLSNPGWNRNNAAIDMMRHTITNNLTSGTTVPVSISSTLTVSNVTVFDDGVSYVCGIGSAISSVATVNVVGK